MLEDHAFSFTRLDSQQSQKQGKRGCLAIEGGMCALPMHSLGASPPIRQNSTSDCETSTTVLILLFSRGLYPTQMVLSCSQTEPSQPLQQMQLLRLKENCSSLFLSVMTPTTMLLFLMSTILMSKQCLPSRGTGSLWKSWQVGPCSFQTSLLWMRNFEKCLPSSSTLNTSFFPNSYSSLAFFERPRLGFFTGEYSSVKRDSCALFQEDFRSSRLFSRWRILLASFRFSLSLSFSESVRPAEASFSSSRLLSLSLRASCSCSASRLFLSSCSCRSLSCLLSRISPVSSASSSGRQSSLMRSMMCTLITSARFSTLTLLALSSATKKQISCTFQKMTLNSTGRVSLVQLPFNRSSCSRSSTSKAMARPEQLTLTALLPSRMVLASSSIASKIL